MTGREASVPGSVPLVSGSGLIRRTTTDAIGVVLFAAVVGWTVMTAGGWTDGAWPVVALYGGSAAAYLVGRTVGRLLPPLVPGLVVALSLWVGWLSVADWLRDGRMEQPFGYPNAQAGFFVLTAVASWMLALVSRRPPARAIGFALAAASAAVVLISGSIAASMLLILPVTAVASRGRLDRWFTVGAAGLVILAILGTVVLGTLYAPTRSTQPEGGLPSLLTERRLALWSDALAIMRQSPLKGVGPGRFGLESPTARSDPDAGWAHNDFLQMGAETGVFGLLLLLGVFLWGFASLAVGSERGAIASLGAAALAALGIQGSVDYVLRFPALPLVTAALVGVAVALTRAPRAPKAPRVPGGETPA